MTNLKVAIVESGLKQKYIAEKIGIRPEVLSRYVNGDRETPEHVIKAIAKVLKVPQWNLR